MRIAWSTGEPSRRWGAIAHDLSMIPIAWLGAYWLRFNFAPIPEEFLAQAVRLLPMIVVIQGAAFLYFGLHRGMWRFASIPDLARIFQAVAVGVSLCALATFFLTGMHYVPRASFVLFALLLIIFLSGPRLTYRWFKDRWFGRVIAKRALIVGAGWGGEMLARVMLRDPSRGYRPIGFVDDDPGKKGRDVRGLPVLGHCGEIPAITARAGADVIVIAIPSANALRMRRIVDICERSDIPMQIAPDVRALASGHISLDDLRPVTLNDLLDREPRQFDWPEIRSELTGRSVVVTGAGGSIGSELCRQIAELEPSRLILVDNSEFNLYQIERSLRDAYPVLAFSIVLADICDAVAVGRIFERYDPDVVFHAAAYKHVPMLEGHMREAVRVNALGTQTIVDTVTKYGTGLFVLVSSDKAVNPTNVMGASKRLAETICHAATGVSPSTRFITVRFGNVLESTGSVVPLFRAQIAHGGPVTVTDPEMQRYFMTIPEACHLIMASATLGKGGEIFVLDMGDPIPIVYLAEQMIRLAGKVPGKEVAIEFVGARPGEKHVEELFHPAEQPRSTRHGKIFLANGHPHEHASLAKGLAKLREACDAFDEPALRHILIELVPEYYRVPSAEEMPGIGAELPPLPERIRYEREHAISRVSGARSSIIGSGPAGASSAVPQDRG